MSLEAVAELADDIYNDMPRARIASIEPSISTSSANGTSTYTISDMT